MHTFSQFLVLSIYFTLVWIDSIHTSSLKGVSPTDLSRYQPDSNGMFTCFDQSKTIPIKSVNDDYCDCQDGSDEPGTAACRLGRFYCANLGFDPSFIPSSRVNDGICEPECCDGSDEFDGKIKCPNICEEKGAQRKAMLADQLRIAQQGAKKKALWTQQGQQKLNEANQKIAALDSELSYLKNVISLKKYQVETAEKEEAESEEQAKKLGKLAPTQLVSHIQRLQSKLTHILASVAQFQNTSKTEQDVSVLLNELESLKSNEVSEDLEPLPLLETSSLDDTSSLSFLDRLKASWRILWNMKTSQPLDLAKKRTQEAREAYQASLDQESKLKEEKQDHETFVQLDIHQDVAFLMLYKECYSLKVDKYIYTLCPFQKATQKSVSDHFEVSLGQWKGQWLNSSTWLFESGQSCWSGPDRSTKVLLECGPKPVILEAEETSRCVYQMKFQNPASCGMDKTSEPELPGSRNKDDL